MTAIGKHLLPTKSNLPIIFFRCPHPRQRKTSSPSCRVVAPNPANEKQLTHRYPPYPHFRKPTKNLVLLQFGILGNLPTYPHLTHPGAISENKPFADREVGQSSSRSTKPHHK